MKTKLTKTLPLFVALTLTCFAAVSSAGDGKTIVETAVEAGSFKTLAAALNAADLVDTLQGDGPFTVFAPTDEAFAKLPEGTVETLLKPENRDQLVAVLTYHVVPGNVLAKQVIGLNGAVTANGQRLSISASNEGVKVDNANVVTTDINCSNGVIHVIDSVILPSSKNLVETASGARTFNTLIAAAKAAGLASVLTGEDALTIFAPTDEAFAKLPEGTVESLLKPENKDQLISILTYHVVAGRVYSESVVKNKTLKSLQGAAINVKAKKNGVKIQGAKLLKADINASNGVVHVIDTVIMPPTNKISFTDAKRKIDHSVAQGSRLFNAGHHDQCASVYMGTMQVLLESNAHMPTSLTRQMESVISQAKHQTCPTQRSWTLRHGLNQAYHALANQ